MLPTEFLMLQVENSVKNTDYIFHQIVIAFISKNGKKNKKKTGRFWEFENILHLGRRYWNFWWFIVWKLYNFTWMENEFCFQCKYLIYFRSFTLCIPVFRFITDILVITNKNFQVFWFLESKFLFCSSPLLEET